MKIGKREELDGVYNSNYEISICESKIFLINSESRSATCTWNSDYCELTEVIKMLNAIGFDIELDKKPKLTKREYDFLKNFKDTFFYRDGDGDLACSNKIPSTIDGFNMSDSTSIFLDNTLLEFIGSGREHVWSVEDLLELEVQND